MRQHLSLQKDFKKKKELVGDDGKIKFNNQKSRINAKGRTKSSQKWLQRQVNDPYANIAKVEGYLARSAYKLLEIQKKYRILEPRIKTIIDLGCSPGSWSQVILTNKQFQGKYVIGVDLLPIKFENPNLHFIQGDIESYETQDKLIKKINDVSNGNGNKKAKVDCILCDIALNNIGNAEIDRIRSERIIELALWFCQKYLEKDGHFVCKAIKGADNSIINDFKNTFRIVHRFKPNSSRKDSSEIFLIGICKK